MTEIEQPSLPLRMEAYPVERSMIFAQPNFRGAMNLSLDLCGFQSDKDAARALGIDAALLSRRRNGQAPWQHDDAVKVMQRGQHLIPLAWQAHQFGHGLVMLETEAERRERAMRDGLAERDAKIAYLEQLVQGRAR